MEPGSKFLRRQAPSLLAVLVLQAKPWLTETVNYWATDINAGPVPSGLGTDSRRTYAWQRQCRQHFAELTVQAANKSGSWVNCIYCQRQESLPKGWHVASYYAATAAELLRLVRGVRHIFTEAKVLKGTCGAFDFSLVLCPGQQGQEERRLEVEVDGEQHFSKPMHGTTANQQRAADRRKDEAAWQHGRCLVRLHYLDSSRWLQVLQDAVRRATLPHRNRFIIYSTSYGLRNRVGPWQVSGGGAAALT